MYTIKEKQKLLEQLQSTVHFESDLKLFMEKFPRHSLNRELARANNVNKERLCSQMIYALLDVCSEADIKANRKAVKAAAKEAKPAKSKQAPGKSKTANAKPKTASKNAAKKDTATKAEPVVGTEADKKKAEPKA